MRPGTQLLLLALLGALATMALVLAVNWLFGLGDLQDLALGVGVPAVVAMLLATALALALHRRATQRGLTWTAPGMALRMVGNWVWLFPALTVLGLLLVSWPAADTRITGGSDRGFVLAMSGIFLLGTLIAAVLWALPAFLLAWWACRGFIESVTPAARREVVP